MSGEEDMLRHVWPPRLMRTAADVLGGELATVTACCPVCQQVVGYDLVLRPIPGTGSKTRLGERTDACNPWLPAVLRRDCGHPELWPPLDTGVAHLGLVAEYMPFAPFATPPPDAEVDRLFVVADVATWRPDKKTRYTLRHMDGLAADVGPRYVEQVYRMVQREYGSRGLTFWPWPLVEEAVRQGAFCVVVRDGSRLVSGGLYVPGGSSLYAPLGTWDREFARLSPMTLENVEAIAEAHRRGFLYVNFGGTPLNAPDLLRFKARFGSRYDGLTRRKVRDGRAYAQLSGRASPPESGPDWFPSYRWSEADLKEGL